MNIIDQPIPVCLITGTLEVKTGTQYIVFQAVRQKNLNQTFPKILKET